MSNITTCSCFNPKNAFKIDEFLSTSLDVKSNVFIPMTKLHRNPLFTGNPINNSATYNVYDSFKICKLYLSSFLLFCSSIFLNNLYTKDDIASI